MNIILIGFLLLATGCSAEAEQEKKLSKLHELNTPIFWAEGHPGNLPREGWQIEVTGLCRKPGTYSWNDLLKLPKTLVDARLTSVTRWSVRGNWGGVRLSDILDSVQADPEVKYLRFWSTGLIYDTSLPVEICRQEKSLLAYEFDGELLTEDYGGPVRVFCPYLWGYKSAKSVVRIELLDHYIPGFWEIRGYSDSGQIKAGPVRDMNDKGRVKNIPDGEVIDFLPE